MHPHPTRPFFSDRLQHNSTNPFNSLFRQAFHLHFHYRFAPLTYRNKLFPCCTRQTAQSGVGGV